MCISTVLKLDTFNSLFQSLLNLRGSCYYKNTLNPSNKTKGPKKEEYCKGQYDHDQKKVKVNIEKLSSENRTTSRFFLFFFF